MQCLKCDSPAIARGVCRKHYRLGRKDGSLKIVQPQIIQVETCMVEGCCNKTSSKNLCKIHYERYRRTGEIVKDLEKSNWTNINIAWVAGIIEGEGTFTIRKSGEKHHITIKVVSTDFDVIYKLYNIVGLGRLNGPYDRSTKKKKRKPFLVWCLHEKYPQVELMNAILPHMCQRRKSRILECLEILNNTHNHRNPYS